MSKLIAHMLVIRDRQINEWRPLYPFLNAGCEPWFYSKTVGTQVLSNLRVQFPDNEYKLAEVRISYGKE